MKQTERRGRCGFLPRHATLADLFTPEDFTEDERLIARTTASFVEKKVLPRLEAIESHDYETIQQLFHEAGEIGLSAIEIPESFGGLSLGKKIACLVAEEMGASGSFGVSFNIHSGVGILPYVYFGSEGQKRKYLTKLASGEWIGAYALTEPGAGSDALNAKTTAVLNDDGSGWVLSGEKQWITNARIADVFVVFAKTEKGMTAFIVEKTFPGVSAGAEEKKMGIKGSSTATLILEDVVVPRDNVLGEIGKGHHVALNILNMARLKLAFLNLGTARQALQLAVNYAKERRQFQTALIDFTLIQEKAADMAVAIYGAESAACRTVGVVEQAVQGLDSAGELVKVLSNYALECAASKVRCSEVLDHVVDEAVQIHGGCGFMQDYPVERLYRDARISRIFEGTNEINRLTIAKSLLKRADDQEAVTEQAGMVLTKNDRYVRAAEQLFQFALKAVSNIDTEKEQEYLRLLADIITDIYVMESAVLRTRKTAEEADEKKVRLKQLATDILCEEGYKKVEGAAIAIISGAVTDEKDRQALMDDIRHLPLPLYENLFIKKREIAAHLKNQSRYDI